MTDGARALYNDHMKKKRQKGSLGDTGKFGVVLEHMDSQFQLVFEGQQGLQKQIDVVGTDVKDLRKEMDYKFEVVFDELHLIRNELKEKVGRDEFTVLEKRVLRLEKQATRSHK